MLQAYRRRRDVVLARLDARGIGYVRPHGAFYLMARVAGASESSALFARRLLEQERVAVIPGSAFGPGGEGMVRLSLAASEDAVAAGVEGLGRALEKMGT